MHYWNILKRAKNFVKFTGKHLRQRLFSSKVAGLGSATYLKETLVQVFSCEFSEIFKNTFFTKHLLAAVSDCMMNSSIKNCVLENENKNDTT